MLPINSHPAQLSVEPHANKVFFDDDNMLVEFTYWFAFPASSMQLRPKEIAALSLEVAQDYTGTN